ncbi:unnamed protein product, partial [Tetraodon nigroviridis]
QGAGGHRQSHPRHRPRPGLPSGLLRDGHGDPGPVGGHRHPPGWNQGQEEPPEALQAQDHQLLCQVFPQSVDPPPGGPAEETTPGAEDRRGRQGGQGHRGRHHLLAGVGPAELAGSGLPHGHHRGVALHPDGERAHLPTLAGRRPRHRRPQEPAAVRRHQEEGLEVRVLHELVPQEPGGQVRRQGEHPGAHHGGRRRSREGGRQQAGGRRSSDVRSFRSRGGAWRPAGG